ncbi:Abhydrolase domain-containing protein C22H12.03 [Candida viswanathii]|uniref:Abhydrolase domain-containing protein C22H12.03 n=1 Tax=Candida viswanathii TaxID=5486 RepID=A0A367YMA2_9ASCO|nr:Abhydrolase domain-containing protein C22H12.03 [Candida viswanathii]
MFCVRRHLAQPRFLLQGRFVQTSTTHSVFKPTFSVDDIKDLPYHDSVNLQSRILQPRRTKVIKEKTPIVFLHGLFESILFFKKIAYEVSGATRHLAYGVDLRNHGTSPHALPFTYSIMAYDVFKFITDKNIEQCILIGHGMGAKVAALVSLLYPSVVEKLVLIDGVPCATELNKNFGLSLLAMCEIESRAMEFKSLNGKRVNYGEVTKLLRELQPYEKAREQILGNLLRTPKDIRGRSNIGDEMFKMPVMNFYKYDVLKTTAGWPQLPNVTKFTKPVWAVTAKQSTLDMKDYEEEFKKYFETVNFETVDTDYWFEHNKDQLVDLLIEIIGRSTVPFTHKKGKYRW